MKSSRKNFKLHIKTKHRRARRNNAKSFSKQIRFLGVNAAGLRSKLFTFKKVLKELQPSVFFIEETKLKDAGRIKLKDYVIFEKPRKKQYLWRRYCNWLYQRIKSCLGE